MNVNRTGLGFWCALIVSIFFAGCAPGPRPTIPPSSGGPQLLDKTFGEVVFSGQTLTLHYKDMALALDPAVPLNDYADYLLLSNSSPQVLSALSASVRKDQKLIVPPAAVSVLNKAGFSAVKGMSAGQTIQLKKGNGFLFVKALPAQNGSNSYFLEFDNGRNIFLSGFSLEEGSLREFLYGLRDEGKEVHMAFVETGSEAQAAQILGLLQPAVGVLIRPSASSGQFDQTLLKTSLHDQMFEGAVRVASSGNSFPF